MGCITLPVWIGIVTAAVTVCFIITIIIINRKWEAIKFFLFVKFNYLINDDPPEYINEMEFDAFVIYR